MPDTFDHSTPAAHEATISRRTTVLAALAAAASAKLGLSDDATAKKKKKKKKESTWKSKQSIGSQGSGDNQLNGPNKVAITADGLELYVADASNHRIAIWNRNVPGSTEWMWSGSVGSEGSAADQLQFPAGHCLSANGLELFIADYNNNRISIWKRDNALAPWQHHTNIGTVGSAVDQLSSPNSVTIAPNQLQLIIADYGSNRMSLWTRATIASNWEASYTFGAPGSNIDQFNVPDSSVISADGKTLFIADYSNNRIALWTRSTVNDQFTANTALIHADSTPCQPALSPDGHQLFVPEYTLHRIAIWKGTTTDTSSWNLETTSDSGFRVNLLDHPYGTAISPNGKELFIADYSNNQIAVWEPA